MRSAPATTVIAMAADTKRIADALEKLVRLHEHPVIEVSVKPKPQQSFGGTRGFSNCRSPSPDVACGLCDCWKRTRSDCS